MSKIVVKAPRMKFGITYTRKVRAPQPFEMLTIGVYVEYDDATISLLEAYNEAKNQVNLWIEEEKNRLRLRLPEPKRRIQPLG